MFKRFYHKFKDFYFSIIRKVYVRSLKELVDSIEGDGVPTIISQNCFAGRIMQDLNIQYNSPTVGLAFRYPDFIDFLRNIEYYMKHAELTFVKKSKYPDINKKIANGQIGYPIGLLGGVEIHFIHYKTAEEAREKWIRRSQRINFNRLFVIGMDRDGCSSTDIENFDNLPFQRKIIFTRSSYSKLKSAEYMPEFKGKEVGNPFTRAGWFYKHLVNHNW